MPSFSGMMQIKFLLCDLSSNKKTRNCKVIYSSEPGLYNTPTNAFIYCIFLVLQIEIDGGVDVPVSFIPQLKAKLKGTFKKGTVPPKAIKRNTRGPVYFKCIPVVYDKEEGKMNIPKGEFAGKSVHRAVGDEDNKEYSETTLALESFENEDMNLAGIALAGSFPFKLLRGSQSGGGFYGYRLKFRLFHGYRLNFFSYG